MHKILSATFAALLVLVSVSCAVIVVESRNSAVASNLGYEGATAWIQVVDLGASDQTPAHILDFVDRHRLGLAYTPSLDSGLLTIYDPYGLFRGAERPLAEPLGGADGPPVALVADLLGPARDDLDAGVLTPGTRIVGGIDSSVSLEGTPLVVVRNPAAGPLGGGLYVLAGAEAPQAQGLVDILARAGAWISDAQAYGPVPAAPYDGARGAVLASLLGLFVVLGVLVILLDVSRDRERLLVAAILGATRRDLRRMTWTRSFAPLSLGTLTGTLVSTAAVIAVSWRLLTDPLVISLTVAAAVAVAVASWGAALGGAAVWQAWRCSSALPR